MAPDRKSSGSLCTGAATEAQASVGSRGRRTDDGTALPGVDSTGLSFRLVAGAAARRVPTLPERGDDQNGRHQATSLPTCCHVLLGAGDRVPGFTALSRVQVRMMSSLHEARA